MSGSPTQIDDRIVADAEDASEHAAANERKERKAAFRSSPLRVIVIIGILLLIGVTALLLLAMLWRGTADHEPSMTEQIRQLTDDIQQYGQRLSDLHATIAGHEQELQRLDAALPNLDRMEAQLAQSRAAIDDISRRLNDLASSSDVRFTAALEQQQGLKAALDAMRAQRRTSSDRSKTSSPPPSPPTPPFSVAGIERRGGVTYLSIQPRGSSAMLMDLRLISEGETADGWRLSSIGNRSAVFNVDGQSVPVPIPVQ